ncbi:MAG: sugar phosphate isomerase/epimerase [Clostridia bacterium]|nr:sugar phosphate isomerase/epimerase [Clostridia bacterium]
MLKISTETRSAASKVGEEKAIELIAKAGFDAFDLSLLSMVRYKWGENICLPCSHPFASENAVEYVKKLRKIGEEYGIVCNQSHAPYPTYCPDVRATYAKCLELTAVAGGEICVIHPDNFKSAEENAEMFFELLPTAHACGVKIATENMWCWSDEKGTATDAACSDPKSFLDHIHAVNDDYLVACLDIGHAELKGLNTSAPEMIEALGPHLQSLHIHDNDKHGDRHAIPFSDSIDFEAVAKALKLNGYNGYLTLEAVTHLSSFAPENTLDGLAELAGSAKKLAKMIENA